MNFESEPSEPPSEGGPLLRSEAPSMPPSSPGMSSALPQGLGSSQNFPNSDFAAANADPAPEEEQNEDNATEVRKRARAALEGIPKVTDALGESVRMLFEQFLDRFVTEHGVRYYVEQIRGLRAYDLSTVYVDYQHMLSHDSALAEAVREQFYRSLPFLQRGLRNIIKIYDPRLLYANAANPQDDETQGGTQTQSAYSTTGSTSSTHGENEKVFQLAFYGLPVINKIRDMHTDKVGTLSSISGTVTRTSEVRPELYRATFSCDACRTVVSSVEQMFKFTEPYMCPNPQCGNRTAWTLIVAKSQFVDWQKVRIQENPGEIPAGSMPRTLEVILRGDVVDRAKPGDKCVFNGALTVVPDVSQYRLPGVRPAAVRDPRGAGRGEGMDGAVRGLKALGVRELSYKLCFMASMVQEYDARHSGVKSDLRAGDLDGEQSQVDFLNSLTAEEVAELRDMVNTDHLYSKLVASIAPSVHGHMAIKKGILLQLMGGVHKQTAEGIQLRGDINVCIVGDPSTSKSQFLKYVTSFLPRSVYTSGKASSAAGLTAAVVKDEESGEFTIEAGALMLADNGICAIDEFDKMDVRDQVAIHEAMEQQTISIAKAGIHATLNARTSILAAANPIGGRYDRKKPLRSNIYMSAPIMSRFDLFFVVLDEVGVDSDTRLADHIVSLHMDGDAAIDAPYTTVQLQRYIQYARTFRPQLTKEAGNKLVELYKKLRGDDAPNMGQRSYRITVRQLESLVRLSEAVARAHCVDEITEEFVREAYNLLKESTINVDYDDVDVDGVDLMAQRTVDRSRTRHALESLVPDPVRPKTTITQEKYRGIVDFLLQQIGPDPDGQPLSGSELVRLYLAHQEGSIQGAEEFEYEQTLVQKVIKRMVRQKLLLELRGESSTLHDTFDDFNEVQYVLHPNAASDVMDTDM